MSIHARTQRYGHLPGLAIEPVFEAGHSSYPLMMDGELFIQHTFFSPAVVVRMTPHPAQVQKAVDLLGWQHLVLFDTEGQRKIRAARMGADLETVDQLFPMKP